MKRILEPSQSLAEQALQRLTEDIAYLQWEPEARLNIELLKRAYGMGGTPIREAVNQLVAVGLVEAIPLKGFQVMPLQAHSSRLCFQSRLHLEQDVFQYLLNLASDEWETQWVAAQYGLKKRWVAQQQKVDLKRWCGAFYSFQSHYILSTGVPWFRHLFGVLKGHIQRYFYHYLSEQADPRAMMEADYQYSVLLSSALLEGDNKAVVAIVEHYWNHWGKRVAEQLRLNNGPLIPSI